MDKPRKSSSQQQGRVFHVTIRKTLTGTFEEQPQPTLTNVYSVFIFAAETWAQEIVRKAREHNTTNEGSSSSSVVLWQENLETACPFDEIPPHIVHPAMGFV